MPSSATVSTKLAQNFRAPDTIDDKGMLCLNGAFGLRPIAVLLDLTFQRVSNRWRLFGMSLGARSISSGFGASPAPAPAPPTRK